VEQILEPAVKKKERLHIPSGAGFLPGCSVLLNVTTYEKKTGFLLIEVFRKLINPQIEGHLDQHWVAISYISV